MKRHLPEEYDRRPIVEAVHSVIERKSGSCVIKDSRTIRKGNSIKDNSIQHQENLNTK